MSQQLSTAFEQTRACHYLWGPVGDILMWQLTYIKGLEKWDFYKQDFRNAWILFSLSLRPYFLGHSIDFYNACGGLFLPDVLPILC